ncbi:MAG TPA: hypothetical protein PLD47_17330 [Aggregatilineales bacterium]|nr:hypothetical protein [Anaerolineales bacterium]HRE49491.1 hypothetical protein [Aggregatilineales bacterium]
MDAHDAASVQAWMVLVGDLGGDKSSFIRHLTLCIAGAALTALGEANVPGKASIAALQDVSLPPTQRAEIERDLPP